MAGKPRRCPSKLRKKTALRGGERAAEGDAVVFAQIVRLDDRALHYAIGVGRGDGERVGGGEELRTEVEEG